MKKGEIPETVLFEENELQSGNVQPSDLYDIMKQIEESVIELCIRCEDECTQ